MPWTVADVDRHIKGLGPEQKRQWVHVANTALKKCLTEGGEARQCEASAVRQANSVVGKAAGGIYAEDVYMAKWTTAYINNLPDSAFLYVEPGGTKDPEGKTTPRGLRHLPYMGEDGKIDLAHLRNAISRALQTTSIPAEKRKAVQQKGQSLLEAEKAKRGMALAVPQTGRWLSVGPVELEDGYPVQRFRKELIRVGTYTHPIKGWTLEVTEARLDQWATAFHEMQQAGTRVPVNLDHNHASDKVKGWLYDIFREGQRLIGILELRGEDAVDLAQKDLDVSIEVDRDVADSQNNVWAEAIVGCAICWDPVVSGQPGFVPIAASKSRGEEQIPLYVLGGKEAAMKNEDLKRLAELLGVEKPEEFKIEGILPAIEAALQAQTDKITELQGEIASLQKRKGDEPDDDTKPELSVDPDTAEALAEATEMRLGALVDKDCITAKVRDSLAAILVGDPGKRNVMCLSRKATGDDADPLAKRILEALADNAPVKLGEATGLQSLTRRVPGDDLDVDEDTQKEMIDEAGGTAEKDK